VLLDPLTLGAALTGVRRDPGALVVTLGSDDGEEGVSIDEVVSAGG